MWLLAALLAALAADVAGTPCFKARTRCAYRTGCGAALNNYMILCNDVLSEPTSVCPKPCEHALIALTSTEEGKELMKVSFLHHNGKVPQPLQRSAKFELRILTSLL